MTRRGWVHARWQASHGLNADRDFRRYLREYESEIPADTSARCLQALLEHARSNVPYFGDLLPAGPLDDPYAVLAGMPLLDKATIRSEGDRLVSRDIDRRQWRYNTSGGSTGEPVRLVQDLDHSSRAGGVTLLYSHLAGRDVGQREVLLWGSERDILGRGRSIRRSVGRLLTNTVVVNAFRMTPAVMREFVSLVNARPPRLILAYATAIYEVARFAESQGLRVAPQHAVMTSAGTLYPFMRETIERVFECPVCNRYGSREVGDMACELPGHDGLWAAPWGCIIEVVDDSGRPISDGVDGEIVVTSLTNFAMPLLRYRIGDRGALAPRGWGPHPASSRGLMRVTGRTVDAFRMRDGTVVDGEYFTHLLYFRDWVERFQVLQRDYSDILVRVVSRATVPEGETEEIAHGIRALMGPDCRVDFEFCQRIDELSSGKYRYTISEVA